MAIGTAHGVYAKAPKLDLDCLGAIAAACSCPLVLHGAAAFRRSSSAHVWRRHLQDQHLHPQQPRRRRAAHAHFTERTGAFELMPFVTDAVKQETMNHIRIFGSEGRA